VVAGKRTTTQVVKSGNKSRQFYAGRRQTPLASLPRDRHWAGVEHLPNKTNFLRELSCEFGLIILFCFFILYIYIYIYTKGRMTCCVSAPSFTAQKYEYRYVFNVYMYNVHQLLFMLRCCKA